jgi:hypothetical protein
MRYLLLVYIDQARVDALSREEMDTMVDESLDGDEALRKSGHYIVSNALQPVHTATTVRVRDGKALITDGPFAETKEHLGGFMLIEARDAQEAVRVASRMPPARIGAIEVRPVRELAYSASRAAL